MGQGESPYTTGDGDMISAFFEETMAPAPRLSLRVPGSTSGVRRAIDALDAFVARHGIVLRAPWQVRLALDETLSNIVKHAYRGRTRDSDAAKGAGLGLPCCNLSINGAASSGSSATV